MYKIESTSRQVPVRRNMALPSFMHEKLYFFLLCGYLFGKVLWSSLTTQAVAYFDLFLS